MLRRAIVGSVLTVGVTTVYIRGKILQFRDDKLQAEITTLCEGQGGVISRSFESDDVRNEVSRNSL